MNDWPRRTVGRQIDREQTGVTRTRSRRYGHPRRALRSAGQRVIVDAPQRRHAVHLRREIEDLTGVRAGQIDRRLASGRRVAPIDHDLVGRPARRQDLVGRLDLERVRNPMRCRRARVVRRHDREIALRQLVRRRRILAVGDRIGIERQLDDHALVNAAHQLLNALPPRRERSVRRHVHRETELVRLVDVHPDAEVRVALVPARVVLNRLHVRGILLDVHALAARVEARGREERNGRHFTGDRAEQRNLRRAVHRAAVRR